jgi:hypothetical protein
MPVCRNADCPVSYQSQEGRLLVSMVRVLRTAHDTNTPPAPATIERLRGLHLFPREVCHAHEHHPGVVHTAVHNSDV